VAFDIEVEAEMGFEELGGHYPEKNYYETEVYVEEEFDRFALLSVEKEVEHEMVEAAS
jgi:hypothetical protein